jgi:hypothetical protein
LVNAAKPDRIVLLGDLFTKGPDPVGVWERIVAWKPECILGNHDAKLLAIWGLPSESKAYATRVKLPEAAGEFLGTLPLFWQHRHAGRDIIGVHAGLHPTEGLAGTNPGHAILLRRWPDDVDHTNPFWWQLWRGPQRVFYGHDAMRGLQVHEHSVGLDTGCCYGNALSGFLLEEERVIQVDPDGCIIEPPRMYHADLG